MYSRIALSIVVLFINVYAYGQNGLSTPERGWTDKNNAEKHAAYMIQLAYNELGYMGVRVQVRDDGARRIFEVEPGRIFHVKAVHIVGKNDLPPEAMDGAPTAGDVYSAARMNDWIATLNSRYKKAASWGVRYDHANADVTIEVGLNADSVLGPEITAPAIN